MKILYLIKADTIGGAEIQLLDIINHFNNKFEKIFVGSYKSYFNKRLTTLNVNYIELIKGNLFREISTNFEIIKHVIVNEKIETIHYFHRIFTPIIWIIKIKYPDIKIIYSAISLFKDLRGFFITADYYLAVSDPVYNNLVHFYLRNKTKVYKISHGINLKKYPLKKIKYLTNPGQKLKLGYAGRLEKSKGIKYLIYMMQELKDYDIELFIQGSGSQEQQLKNLTVKLDISTKVIFSDWDEDMTGFFQRIEVLILPSIRLEGFGLILLEALASRKIVIASNTAGIPDIIKHNMNGFLVRPKNINDLKKYVLNIYFKRIDPAKIEEGIQISLKDFSLDLKLIEYENFYNKIFVN